MRINNPMPRPTKERARQSEQETPPKPDLVVDKFEANQYFPDLGERVHFKVTVRNQGKVDSPAFALEVEGWGVGQKQVRVAGLPAGHSRLVKVGPMRTGGFPGPSFVDTKLDVDNEVDESNERNNSESLSIVIRDPFPPRPPIPPFPRP